MNSEVFFPEQQQGTHLPFLRFALAATLFIAFFFADHDFWYSLHPFEDTPAATFAAAMDSGSVQRQVCFAAIGVISALVLLGHRGPRRIRRGMLGVAAIAFISWSAMSVLWADAPWLATRRLGVFALFLLATLAVTREFSAKDTFRFAAVSAGTYLAIGVLAECVLGTFHPFQAGYRFAGTLHPNGQGMNCGLLCLSSLALIQGRRRSTLLLSIGLVAGLSFLLLTGSRTATASVVVMCLIYALSTAGRRRFMVPAFCFVISIGALVTLLGGSTVSAARNAALLWRAEGATSLSGRLEVWEDLLDYVHERPALGYGYGAFWTPVHILDVSERQQWSVASSHSEYLEVALDLGCIGLALYVLTMVTGLLRAARLVSNPSDPHLKFYFGLLLFYCLDSLLESHLSNPGLVVFLAAVTLTHLVLGLPDGGRPVVTAKS